MGGIPWALTIFPDEHWTETDSGWFVLDLAPPPALRCACPGRQRQLAGGRPAGRAGAAHGEPELRRDPLSPLPALGCGTCDFRGWGRQVLTQPGGWGELALPSGCSGPKIKVISERKTGERWPRAWAWGRSTQIRGSRAVLPWRRRVGLPGRSFAKGGPARVPSPTPAWALDSRLGL